MAIQQTAYQPTASQYASAATHLETPINHIRIDGQRIAIVTSGNSNRVYWLPAAGTSCPCIWWEQTHTTCSHLLALELDALAEELAEAPQPFSWQDLRNEFAFCAAACGSLVPSRDVTLCDECSARIAKEQRMAAARARVIDGWL